MTRRWETGVQRIGGSPLSPFILWLYRDLSCQCGVAECIDRACINHDVIGSEPRRAQPVRRRAHAITRDGFVFSSAAFFFSRSFFWGKALPLYTPEVLAAYVGASAALRSTGGRRVPCNVMYCTVLCCIAL